jgi:hypothetical protein
MYRKNIKTDTHHGDRPSMPIKQGQIRSKRKDSRKQTAFISVKVNLSAIPAESSRTLSFNN